MNDVMMIHHFSIGFSTVLSFILYDVSVITDSLIGSM